MYIGEVVNCQIQRLNFPKIGASTTCPLSRAELKGRRPQLVES